MKKEARRFTFVWSILPIACLIASALAGCTPARKLVYFQGETSRDDTLSLLKPFIPLIRQGDILQVHVSSLNADASAYFNPSATTDGSTLVNTLNPLTRTPGYLVAEDGTIKLPLIGKLLVEGLTNDKAAESITDKLNAYLKEPTVIVRNLNFRISVLGEVTRPSLYAIPNEQITLPEAIGLAGDLTIYGRRDNVLVIRQENGKRIFVRLNLTQRKTFQSPYYFLHPSDIVYVEPGKARLTSVDQTYQLAPIAIGLLSIVAIILTRR